MRLATGGPCDHCGRTSTPCWRKGPPEKPCLCNACGARWLVKRCLEGYEPKVPTQPLAPATASTSFTNPKAAPQRQKASTTGKRKQREHPRLQLERKAIQFLADHQAAALSLDHYASSSATDEDYGFDAMSEEQQGPLTFHHHHHLAHHTHHQFHHHAYVKAEDYYYCDAAQMQEASAAAMDLVKVATRQPSLPMFHRRPRKQARPVACTC